MCLVGKLKNRVKSRGFLKEIEEWRHGEKRGQEKRKIKEERGGQRKYCLPLYPPFTTSVLFVQMPNGLLCETQGLQVNVDTGVVFSESSTLSVE